MTDPTPLPEVPRWHLCRQCGMVRDIRGQAHSEYGRYEEQGPYFIREADHLTAMRQQRDTALREALALVREREADLLSCHKDDDCRTYAYMAGVIADDIQYLLIDGGDTHG